MKRARTLLLALVMVLSLAACGEDGARTSGGANGATVNDLLNGAASSAEAASAAPVTADWQDAAETKYDTVDVDLTQLSSTLVYSEVYAMMTAPDQYIGKTVRMKGTFSVFEDEGNYYYACLIADATACCSQGIEFITARERTFPDGYPSLGTEITVVGVFRTYQEGGYTYCQLTDAELR